MLFWVLVITICVACVAIIHRYGRSTTQENRLQYILFVGLPFLSIPLYLIIGEPNAASTSPAYDYNQIHGDNEKVASIGELIPGLKLRVDAAPDNGELWLLLAQSYEYVGDQVNASNAYERAKALGYEKSASEPHGVSSTQKASAADALADQADAAAVRNGTLVGEAQRLIEQALHTDPTHIKALWLAGSLQVEKHDYAKALGYWQKLASLIPLDSPEHKVIQANMAEAREKANVITDDGAKTIGLKGVVRLDDDLSDSVAPTDTVFVVAKAAGGPAMPLAVVRKSVKDLPFEFVLNDSNAMVPQFALSAFEDVVVSARISKTGSATRSTSDYESETVALMVSNAPDLDLVISQ